MFFTPPVSAAGKSIASLPPGADKFRLPGVEVRPLDNYSDPKNADRVDVLTEPALPRALDLSGPVLTLDECLRLAFENSPDITEARYYIAQYEAKVRQALSLYVPDASIELSHIDYGIPALRSSFDNNSAAVQLSHVLYDSGKRSELVKAAQNSLNAANYSFLSTWNQKAYQVAKAYYELVYTYWLTGVSEDDLEKTQDNLNIAQGFYKTGSKARIDVTQAEIQVRTSEINLIQAKNSLFNAYDTLVTVIGSDVMDLKNRRIEDNLVYKVDFRSRDSLLSQMASGNPTLSYYDYLRLSALDLSNSYLADRLPVFSANAMWGGKSKWSISDQSWAVNFQLSIPLLKNTESKAYSDEQKAVAAQTESKKQSEILKLTNQIDMSIANIFSGQKRVDTAYRSVETALLNYKLSYLRYKQGVSTIIELNNAIDYLNNARQEYLKALYEVRLADTVLKQAVGNPLPQNGTPGKHEPDADVETESSGTKY